MKKSYNKSVQLRCAVCGSADDFESNEDKTYIKCKKCNKEYHGGYDELVELNQAHIQEELEDTKAVVREIWVGPTNNVESSYRSLNMWLESMRLERRIQIKTSTAPFR